MTYVFHYSVPFEMRLKYLLSYQYMIPLLLIVILFVLGQLVWGLIAIAIILIIYGIRYYSPHPVGIEINENKINVIFNNSLSKSAQWHDIISIKYFTGEEYDNLEYLSFMDISGVFYDAQGNSSPTTFRFLTDKWKSDDVESLFSAVLEFYKDVELL